MALTGAGISVDSGIPDFRSPGGLWEKFNPMDYASIHSFVANPGRVWEMLVELESMVTEACPNPGHEGLTRLEQAGVLDGIVTQNIDNLHQEGGSERVVEFHGNCSTLRCMGCFRQEPASRRQELGMPPSCSCGGVFKPDVVFFGEQIPDAAMKGAMDLVRTCQVMLVIGTSATVAPASTIPLMAKSNGALLVELNLTPTEISRSCDISVYAGSSELMPLLAEMVESRLS